MGVNTNDVISAIPVGTPVGLVKIKLALHDGADLDFRDVRWAEPDILRLKPNIPVLPRSEAVGYAEVVEIIQTANLTSNETRQLIRRISDLLKE